MARTETTEGQALWQPGGAEDDSHFREGNMYLRLAQEEEEEEVPWQKVFYFVAQCLSNMQREVKV